MKKSELNNIISIGEGLHAEFKRSASHLGREICAFANSSGGRILLGVDDTGRIVGVSNPNRVKSEVQTIARAMDPPLVLSIDAVDHVLVVTVPDGPDKPYSANGKFYLREAANSQQMRRSEIREFFFKEGLVRFDEQVNREFNFNHDFSIARYNEFVKSAGISDGLDRKDVLRNLQVLKDDGLTNAGVLVFSRDPIRFFISAKVNCVLFQGKSKRTILDQQIYEGGVPELSTHTVNYLKSHLNTEYIIKGGPREELLELPEDALREAVVNAIAHRDYRLTGHIQVHIFQDRVEIMSPGGLVSGLQHEDLGRVSLPRNSLLFGLMHRIELVEHIGSGIKRIRDAVTEYGLSPPIFESGEVWFSTTFLRKPTQMSIEDMRREGQMTSGDITEDTENASEKTSEKKVGDTVQDDSTTPMTTPMTTPKTTPMTTQEKLLDLLRVRPDIGRKELAASLGITADGVKYHLNRLRSAGKIRHIGPSRGGRWETIEK